MGQENILSLEMIAARLTLAQRFVKGNGYGSRNLLLFTGLARRHHRALCVLQNEQARKVNSVSLLLVRLGDSDGCLGFCVVDRVSVLKGKIK